MKMRKDSRNRLRLLIHHHHLAFLGEAKDIWLSANIGRWVDAIANHVDEIGLLFYQSEHKSAQQSTLINKGNVRLHSLGKRKTTLRRILSPRYLQSVCLEAGKNADGLLIRGVTPHQLSIWRNTPVAYKSFLLVGSIIHSSRRMPRSIREVLALLVAEHRKRELRYIAGNDTLMMANSPVLISELQDLFGKRAHFSPTNSISESEFPPLRLCEIGNPIRLLYCGRLDYRKGLAEMIEALAILASQDYSYELDIVAEKIEPYYEELSQLAEKLGVSSRIYWHGFVPYGPTLFQIYQSADIFVIPTYSEGFPKVIWEAAANSCPIVASSVGGIPAILKNEVHALLIPPKDSTAIALAITRMAAEESLRMRLVDNAYQLAKTYTVEACAMRLVETLRREWGYNAS